MIVIDERTTGRKLTGTARAEAKRSRLTLEEVVPIAAYGARATWPAGFQLYQRGAAADGVFVVLNGHIVLRNKIKVGRGFVPVIATVGQTFGSEGLSPNSDYVTDANASEETKTLFLSGAQFRAFVREQPGQTLPLLSQIMSERAYLLEKLHELAALNVDQRLISTLSHLSTDRSFTTDDGRLKLENNHHRQRFSPKGRRLPVPTSLQYPLERERDLERRWNRRLQRTAPKKDLGQKRRASASPRRSPSSAFRPARTATATG